MKIWVSFYGIYLNDDIRFQMGQRKNNILMMSEQNGISFSILSKQFFWNYNCTNWFALPSFIISLIFNWNIVSQSQCHLQPKNRSIFSRKWKQWYLGCWSHCNLKEFHRFHDSRAWFESPDEFFLSDKSGTVAQYIVSLPPRFIYLKNILERFECSSGSSNWFAGKFMKCDHSSCS